MIGYLFARELLRDILELFDNKGEKVFYLKSSVFYRFCQFINKPLAILKISLNSSLGNYICHSNLLELVDLNEEFSRKTTCPVKNRPFHLLPN